MTTQPTITAPFHRTNPFRSCDDADKREPWYVSTTAAMVALPYVRAGDEVFVDDGGFHKWLVIPANSLTVSSNVLNGTVVSCQFLRDGVQIASSVTDGLMPSGFVTQLSGLRITRRKTTSVPAMQALTSVEIGDDCCVSTSSGDNVWLAVEHLKYPYGENSKPGTNGSTVDWVYQIDRITGFARLISGHVFVSIPGVPIESIPKAPGYVSIVGQPGTLVAAMVANGLTIDSYNNPFDGSLVSYEVTILQ